MTRTSTRIGLALGATLMVAGAAAAAGGAWRGPSLVAEERFYNRHDPSDVERTQTYVSRAGMRAEMKLPGPQPEPVVAIVNYVKARCWLLRPLHKTYIEDPLDPKTGECTIGPAGLSGEAQPLAGLWNDRPCEGYSLTKQLGKERVGERDTVRWACTQPQTGESVLQWFDPGHKLVVREEDRDGTVVELHNIRPAANADSLFELPAGYRRVAQHEFFPELPGAPVAR